MTYKDIEQASAHILVKCKRAKTDTYIKNKYKILGNKSGDSTNYPGLKLCDEKMSLEEIEQLVAEIQQHECRSTVIHVQPHDNDSDELKMSVSSDFGGFKSICIRVEGSLIVTLQDGSPVDLLSGSFSGKPSLIAAIYKTIGAYSCKMKTSKVCYKVFSQQEAPMLAVSSAETKSVKINRL